MSYSISLNPMLFKNIAHVGSFKHFVFVYLRICVIVYLRILHLIHGNVIVYRNEFDPASNMADG